MVIRSEYYDDVYFSAQDGLAETQHVFLQSNHLPARFAAMRAGEVFTIAETGFGTGLNFLAARTLFHDAAPQGAKLHFISFEKHPLEAAQMREALAQWDLDVEAMLAAYPQGGDVDAHVQLSLHLGDVNEILPRVSTKVDAWFLDGFRPASNPDMWTQTVFDNMARLSVEGGTFATFTAAGFVRRGLASAGYEVTKIPGYGRKREMSVGVLR